MATDADIAQLRSMIAEPINEEPYTDETLKQQIDGADSLPALAAQVWRSKAASLAHLVNISEGGSSRSMGDLYKNAIAMAGVWQAAAGGPAAVETSDAPFTTEITRA